ncbi:hypothetical protein OEZ85_010956 [Tetradesmus obliquus]|uniref:Uncharacterized protein n=1 Tax=Tetradesmus obliquus TaxID=3088 RepID=A0ABY8TTI8_TETOB|nr:hypothetical protein OEZ85_010956 [Tetradesmus obliquus]
MITHYSSFQPVHQLLRTRSSLQSSSSAQCNSPTHFQRRQLMPPRFPENFWRDLLSRKTLERTKWAIFVSVPIWFGYGFARNPDNLEWVKEVFPTAAADPQAHGAKELPTLADALAAYTLEQKVDAALEELRKKKEAQQKK